MRLLAEVVGFIAVSAAGIAFLRARFDLSQEVVAELLMTAAAVWAVSLILRDRGHRARASAGRAEEPTGRGLEEARLDEAVRGDRAERDGPGVR